MAGKKAARIKKAGAKYPSIDTDKHPWPYCEITWHDATSEERWKPVDDLPNVSVIVTRGWLVRTTKICVTIAASIAEVDQKDGSEPHPNANLDVGEIITIPRGCVTAITELKVSRALSKKVALH